MKLIIVRHGVPNYKLDVLTEQGKKEAEALSERLCKLDIKKAYVSPLGRARETASYTLKKINLEEKILPWLCEFRGRSYHSELKRDDICWDLLPQEWVNNPIAYDKDKWFEYPPFKDTNVKEEYLNVINSFDDLIEKHGYKREGNYYKAIKPNCDTIVFFCHFGIECVLLSRLINVSPMVLWHNTVALTSSVTTVITEERRKGIATFRINGFSDISHLYNEGLEESTCARFCETFANENERHD